MWNSINQPIQISSITFMTQLQLLFEASKQRASKNTE